MQSAMTSVREDSTTFHELISELLLLANRLSAEYDRVASSSRSRSQHSPSPPSPSSPRMEQVDETLEQVDEARRDRRMSMPTLLGSHAQRLQFRAKFKSAPELGAWLPEPSMHRSEQRKLTPLPQSLASKRSGNSLGVDMSSVKEAAMMLPGYNTDIADMDEKAGTLASTSLPVQSFQEECRQDRTRQESITAVVDKFDRRSSWSSRTFSSEGSQPNHSPRQVHRTRQHSRSSSFTGGSCRASGFTDFNFQPWPTWEYLNNSERWTNESESGISSLHVKRQQSYAMAMQTLQSQEGSVESSNGLVCYSSQYLQKLVLHPNSMKRLFWVVLTIALIGCDLVRLPLCVFDFKKDVSFGIIWAEDSSLSRGIDYFTAIFWTCDFCASFLTGYYEQTAVQTDWTKTARRYVLSWMMFDAALLISNWLVAFASWYGVVGVSRAVRLVQKSKALRSLKLLRIARMPDACQTCVRALGHSEYARLMLNLSFRMLGILLLNHFIACVWFFIGNHENGWVNEFRKGRSVMPEMLYATSLHWSLTQFTPATMSVQPVTFLERIFAVAVLLFALIVFSSFVSSITNLMTHLFNLNSTEAKQFIKLDRYLHANNISFRLSVRVRGYLEHLLQNKSKNSAANDSELLAKLSEPLQMELKYEVHSPLLSKHPFFLYLSLTNLSVVQRLCLEALQLIQLAAGDTAFGVGDTAWAMYFVAKGVLFYSKQGDRLPVSIQADMWVCESVLWTPWEHRGDMKAVTETSLLALGAEKFHKIMGKNKIAAQEPTTYALEAIGHLNNQKKADLSDLDYATFDYEGMARRAFEIEEQEEFTITSAKDWIVSKVSRTSLMSSGYPWRRQSAIGVQRPSHVVPS